MSGLPEPEGWLSIPEAAQSLALAIGRELGEAELLRLALDGKLPLSIRIGSQSLARCGRVMPCGADNFLADSLTKASPRDAISAASLAQIPGFVIPDGSEGVPWSWHMGLRTDEARFLVLGNAVATIEGIWGLPMIGDERLWVEQAYQLRSGVPKLSLPSLYGAFLAGPDGQICQLQERGADNDRYHDRPLKEPREHPDNFHPTGAMPEGSDLVIPADALKDLEAVLAQNPYDAGQPPLLWEPGIALVIFVAPVREA
jgi:hypothetical protein